MNILYEPILGLVVVEGWEGVGDTAVMVVVEVVVGICNWEGLGKVL